MALYLKILRMAAACLLLGTAVLSLAQEPGGKSAEKPVERPVAAKAPDKATVPFQIQLLETHIRFESNGDSRKEVHTIVKLNNAAGAQQFSRLGFDYNRAFQQVEIPMVRITHTNGGTSEVLPSAISDAPSLAVEKYPAYVNVRAKSVRILGLQEGDTIEYEVVTTTTKQPLAPDFWLEHTFDRSGQVLKEIYQLELPKPREVQLQTLPEILESHSEPQKTTDSEYVWHRWDVDSTKWEKGSGASTEKSADLVLTSYKSWRDLAAKIGACVQIAFDETIWSDARQKIAGSTDPSSEALLYDLVSTKIKTIEVPLAFDPCSSRTAKDVLVSGYGSPQEKAKLLTSLLQQHQKDKVQGTAWPYFYTNVEAPENELPRPSLLRGMLVAYTKGEQTRFVDPSLEVAPYGMIPVELRGKNALRMVSSECPEKGCWTTIPRDLPFAAIQKVGVNAQIGEDGKLRAKVKYTLRGDNELLLRMAFHQTPAEKWKEVAGLLALSDGFRGVITSATASDPKATKDPFTVEYELTQDKFVDWSKKPVRIPALLPQIGLPEVSGRNSQGNIDLGTPLDVETQVTLHLPEGTTVQAPAGTKVERDYATYSSKYGFTANTLTALRHIHFIQREVAADRAIDYSAFVQAVQNDQSQYFVMDRGTGVKSARLN